MSQIFAVLSILIIFLLSPPPTFTDGACYPTQSAELVRSDVSTYPGNRYGISVAISGPVVVVGAHADDELGDMAGAAYVWKDLDGSGTFVEIQKLTASDAVYWDNFGKAVAIDGHTIVCGAPNDSSGSVLRHGAAYVFQDLDNTGVFVEKNKFISTDIAYNDYFGESVAVHELTVFVGVPEDTSFATSTGSVFVFKDVDVSGNFIFIMQLTASDAAQQDKFGWSSAIGTTIALIGAPWAESMLRGKVYVFQDADGTGNFVEYKQFSPAVGVDHEKFGTSLGYSGDIAVIGAMHEFAKGSAYVFHDSLGTGDFVQIQKLVASDADMYDGFGFSVAISGLNIAVSAYGNDGVIGNNIGSAYFFSDFGTGLFEEVVKVEALDPQVNALFGYSVAISEGTMVSGAHQSLSGSAYVYEYDCVDECLSSPCLNEGTCTDDFLSFTCSCPDVSSGILCETCHCSNGGLCNNGPKKCNCTGTGFYDNLCETDIDDCLSNPCMNNGICTDGGAYIFNCDCMGNGFTGDLCQSDIDDCVSSPCLNNANCTDLGVNDFLCGCRDVGFEGDICQTNIDFCRSSPCLNAAICIDELHGYTCDCAGTGYEGNVCQTDVDDCASSPCYNGAKCSDNGVNKYKCNCKNNGFYGKLCEVDIDDCASSPCFNGAECYDQGANSFACDCNMTGFSGLFCEEDVNDCHSSPCLNNGDCTDLGKNAFECACLKGVGFEGSLCENDIDDCLSFPCQNDGTCTDTGVNAFTCECPISFGGVLCENQDVGGWTSSGDTEAEIIEVVIDFSSFNVSDHDAFLEDLPSALANSIGGDPIDFNVALLGEDGNYSIVIVFTNTHGDSTAVIEEKITGVPAISDSLNDADVRATVVSEPEEKPSGEGDDDGDDGDLLWLIILIAFLVSCCCFAVFFFYKKQERKPTTIMEVPV